MKNSAGFIVTILIIAAPIVWCCINLININNDYEEDTNQMDEIKNMEDSINNVIDKDIANNSSSEGKASGDSYSGSIGGESFESSIGAPIGKIVEGTSINISVANVYTNPDETSGIVGTVTKNTEVTSQDYPKGWSRIKVGELSGWVKTEYITKPENTIGNTTIGTVIGKKAIVNVDSLNVREQPVNGKVITTLTIDTDVKILDVNDDESWYQIQWRTTSGWVSSKYVTVEY